MILLMSNIKEYYITLTINLNAIVMKKFYLSLAMCGFAISSFAQFPAPYCAVTFPSGSEPISLVQFAGIDNATSAAVAGALQHEDFTAIAGVVVAGTSYPISVNGNTDGSYTNKITVYIDWNQDNDFDDDGETYQIGDLVNSTGTGTPISSNILVPVTAMAGSTRMRVVKKFFSVGLPCNAAGFGQAEDYTVTVTAAEVCTGTPIVGAVSASATTICAGNPIGLTAVVTPTAGFTYQWEQSVDAGVTWISLGAVQTNLGYSVSSQEVATSYRVVVTCTGSGLSATSDAVAVAQNPYTECYCTNEIDYTCDEGDLIMNVTFGDLNNDSECSAPTGYTNYSGTVATVDIPKGTTTNISVTVGPSGGGWLYESAGVWIDYNHNGVFDETEFTYIGTGLNEVLTQSVVVPEAAMEGPTRMRVIVTASQASAFNAGVVCGPADANNPFGEAEDYMINLVPSLGTQSFGQNSIAMYPNPTTSQITIDLGKQVELHSVGVYSLSGQQVFLETVNSNTASHTLNVSRLATGVYMVKVITDSGTFSQRLMKK